MVSMVSQAERVIEATDERGLGDSDALITIRCHSDSEMWKQGFLNLTPTHVTATLTMGFVTTDSSLRVIGPYILAGGPKGDSCRGNNTALIFTL